LIFITFSTATVKTEFKGVFLGFLETNEKDHRTLDNTVKATPSGKPIAKIEESNGRRGAGIYFSRNSIVLGWGGNYRIQLVFAQRLSIRNSSASNPSRYLL
jgi:hypothetical protein